MRVGDGLTLCGIAHFTLAIVEERYYGRRCSATFTIRYNYRLIASITETHELVVPKSMPITFSSILNLMVLTSIFYAVFNVNHYAMAQNDVILSIYQIKP